MNKPICKCCDSDEFIHVRKGGGYRCTRCGTIFDDFHRVIGPQEYEPIKNQLERIPIYSTAVTGNLALG